MKRKFWPLLGILPLLMLMGCNNEETIEDPPAFVEMYLDEETAVQPPVEETALLLGANQSLLGEVTNLEYDDELYSESDFDIFVITNGANYDLLFSVELTDSLLGQCIYTDQSTVYKAFSTVIVESDGTYTTEVKLTVPGSTDHTAYLSDRTISLTKILFTRDTANGTFPADIPENTTTSLLFEIHAVEYFDATIGLPLKVVDGKVDLLLTPSSEFYAQAQTAAVSAIVVPATVNGYDIGRVYLQDLSWVVSLTIGDAYGDVFLLGTFDNLTTLSLDGFSFPIMTEGLKHITLNGSFPALTEIELNDIDRYRLFLSRDSITENEDYLSYLSGVTGDLYSFPLLETITITNSRMGIIQLGRDTLGLSFPVLRNVILTDTVLSEYFDLGSEGNGFPKLEGVTFTGCFLSEVRISGSKPATETPATLTLATTEVDYSLEVAGSLFGTLSFTGSVLGDVEILGGNTYPSPLSQVTFATTVLSNNNASFNLFGSHPSLTTLSLTNLHASGGIRIGNVDSEFASLTEISLSGVEAYAFYIGDRNANFPLLTHIVIDDSDFSGQLYIGGENALYPELAGISITYTTASNLKFGYGTLSFPKVILILLDNVVISDTLALGEGANLTLLDNIVLGDTTALTTYINAGNGTYDCYIKNLASTAFYITGSGCQKIYLSESDVTTWAHYAYANGLGIPMETGLFGPIPS